MEANKMKLVIFGKTGEKHFSILICEPIWIKPSVMKFSSECKSELEGEKG